MHPCTFFFFFFNDTATTEIYTLSLHDALPISSRKPCMRLRRYSVIVAMRCWLVFSAMNLDRKSTRLNSSHLVISYAVFCLKKKKITDSIALYSLHHLATRSALYNTLRACTSVC